ncbi:hypothetical protein HT031_005682 [Scenedesmus sp. PABB004]|nr:hypothetical protein HT031_005682 [Scenedesmus sp. PABB004]
MASSLAALQAAGLALQDVPRFRFCLLYGSVLTTHPRYAPAFRERVPVPSCHVIGHKDYVKEHSIALARAFEAPIVIMHGRGHVVPPLAREHLAVLRAFLTAMRDLPPPAGPAPGRAQLEPLDPPRPVWEAEAEQAQEQSGAGGERQQQGFVHRLKLSGRPPSKL